MNATKWKLLELRSLRNFGIKRSVLNEFISSNYRKESYKIYRELPLKVAESYGLKFSKDTDPMSLIEMFVYNEYDFPEFRPNHGELVVDVGANVGDSALWWWRKFGANVIAFEPLNSAFKALKENIELNKAGENITSYNVAIGDGEIITGGVEGLMFSSHGNVQVYTVPLDQFKLVNVKILKIDVEGFEMEVLKGSEKTIKSNLPKIIIETHSTELRKKCHTFLTNMGYRLKIEGRTLTSNSPGFDRITNLFYST